MKNLFMLSLLLWPLLSLQAQHKPATIKETKKVFKTYAFSDPDPIAHMSKIYPYFRFDGYTDQPVNKEWKVVELENEFIRLIVLPEIGGKIWAAWEKSTGKPFIYYNQVVKFRDIAMRGPWTSGGIEANYGIIGHTPNCATPMDYRTETKKDGSVSCYIGTLDLLTQTYWTIEINLASDKGYFTTRSFWSNATPLEQPYYTWMNTGLKSAGNLEFIYPGNRYIGHSGEYADWKINAENGKDISFYENNNFGGPKSYHVFGKYTNFFGAYYHDEDFGMARYSLRDEKAGKKIWIWGLSQQGMIWEKLLSDNDGQYVEVQSGRLFNQAAERSNYTPFKQLGFAPYTSDTWTEYWFPVKGTKGFVKANEFVALNVRSVNGYLKIDISPLQDIEDELKITAGEKVLYSKKINLKTLRNFADSIIFTGDAARITVTLGDHKMQYRTDSNDGVMNRPVKSPADFDWESVFGLYTLGKEDLQQRDYEGAEEKLTAALKKDPNYLPALSDMAMLAYRNMDYKKSLAYATHALSIDTYDPAGNFYYGLANLQSGNVTDAKDGFDIASLSVEFRGAAYTELSKIYLREKDFAKALHYANKALEVNSGNSDAYQTIALINRIDHPEKDLAQAPLNKLNELSPLNCFIRFEQYRWDPSESSKKQFTGSIQNEMPHQSFLQLADWYYSVGQLQESLEVLRLAPENPEVYYWMAFLTDQLQAGDAQALIEKANNLSPALVFPFRASSEEVLTWVVSHSSNWKPKYYSALIHWSRNDTARAKELFSQCGEPDFAAFYASRAELFDNDQYEADIDRASRLDPGQWRYGKLMIGHQLKNKNYQGALTTANAYHKKFPGDFRLSMLVAKALVMNKQYKASSDILSRTSILPYEGATEGRQLYRESWLMQAIQQIQSKRYKEALASISRSKLWPENLGVGKPYDENIDSRVEDFLEATCYEKTKKNDQAIRQWNKIVDASKSERHQITDLITALALRNLNRSDEGEKLLKEWMEKQPENKMAAWAYAVYHGDHPETVVDENENFRIIEAVTGLVISH